MDFLKSLEYNKNICFFVFVVIQAHRNIENIKKHCKIHENFNNYNKILKL